MDLRRVALVGLPNSGKTALLLSLLRHVQQYSAELLRYDSKGRTIKKVRQLPANGHSFGTDRESFCLDKYYRALVADHAFPHRTTIESVYSCEITLAPKGQRVHLDFLDIPGDRFYDVEMIDAHTHDKWSDAIESHWDLDPHPAMDDYRKVLDCEGVAEPEVIAAYRTLLANLVADYRTCITPSTFRLSDSGNPCSGRTPEAILESTSAHILGSEKGAEFAPLFKKYRSRHPGLSNAFAKSYQKYQKKVTERFKDIELCDTLAIVVDVPFILAAGNAAYEDQFRLIERVLHQLAPEPGKLQAIGRTIRDASSACFSRLSHKFHHRGLKRVVFVATKLDLVAYEDRNRLRPLLESLIRPLTGYLDATHFKTISVSAIKSTNEATGKAATDAVGYLFGRPQYEKNNGEIRRRSPSDPALDFMVSRLPEDWPRRYEANSYFYPPVFPEVPHFKANPPDQENLNQLFQFILD